MCVNVAKTAGESIPDEYKLCDKKELYNAIHKLEKIITEEREQYEIEEELYIEEINDLKKQINSLKHSKHSKDIDKLKKEIEKQQIEINKLKEELSSSKVVEPKKELKEKRRPVIKLIKNKKDEKKRSPPPKQKFSANLCIDCSKSILKESTRCNSCSNKYRFLQNKEGRPSYEQIMKDKAELKSFTALGKKYGKSNNAVRKWIKMYEKYL